MSELTKQASVAVAKLLESDEEQLYEELGMRAKALAKRPELAGSFVPKVEYSGVEMGAMEEVRAFGKRLFHRWNREAHGLICGVESEDDEDRKELIKRFGVDASAIAAGVAGLLVAHLGLAPALAAVVATLVVKRFLRPTYEEFCSFWGEKLER